MPLSALLTAATRSFIPSSLVLSGGSLKLPKPLMRWGLVAALAAAALTSGAARATPSSASQADMSVEIKGLPDTSAPGYAIKATVICLNKGPAAAQNASCDVPTAELPAGATVLCTPQPAPNPLPSKSAITCAVAFNAPASGAIQVLARTQSATPDAVMENNRAADSVQLWESADMRATTTLPGTVVGGQPVTVRGVCRNAGPGTASAPSCVISGLPSGATQSCVPSPAPYLFAGCAYHVHIHLHGAQRWAFDHHDHGGLAHARRQTR
jgi:hypothetical protein